MNKDQLILEQIVEDIYLEIKGHGSYKDLTNILHQAEKDGLIKWKKKNGKMFIYSLKDKRQYIAHDGEIAVIPVQRFLASLTK